MSRNRSLDEFLEDDEVDADREDPEDPDETADSEHRAETADSGDADSADDIEDETPPDTGDLDARDDAESADDAPDGEGSVEPIVSTSGWVPGGAACAGCGATVERRWRDGDRLVCRDCKDW